MNAPKHILNTQAFIEQHYHRQLTPAELEGISCYSYRNLQRVFKSVYGETIGSYQTRLKVENAYKQLLYSNEVITRIAVKVGFADVQALRKAFKKRFGVPPSEARAQKLALLEAYQMIPAEPRKYTEPEIVHWAPPTLWYQSLKTHYDNQEIETLWDSVMEANYPTDSLDCYGLIIDDPLITEEIHCRYDACVDVAPTDRNFPQKNIQKTKYARFMHYGSYDHIVRTYQMIYGGWALHTGSELSELPIIEHYLIHGDHTVNEAEFETAIYLPLR